MLVLLVLIPTLGMGIMAYVTAQRANSERSAAQRLRRDTDQLLATIEARTAIADEEVATSVIAIAASAGASPEDLAEIYGIDFAAQLADARAAVDSSEVLATDPDLTPLMRLLTDLRPMVDAGTATAAEVRATTWQLAVGIDAEWDQLLDRRAEERAARGLPAEARVRIDGLIETYELLASGSSRAATAITMVIDGPTRANLAEMIRLTSRYDTAASRFDRILGVRAIAVWRAHEQADSTIRFEDTIRGVMDDALAERPSPLTDDIVAFGDAFIDGATWGDGLTAIVRAASDDLEMLTADHLAGAESDLRWVRIGAVLLALISLIGTLRVARWVVRPVRDLEVAAQQIHQGRFDLPAMTPRGPREIADTASAFNDMASTLAAVEGHAVALADDPGAPILSDTLPGRTGRALQVALNRLRSSMQAAEEHRAELQRAATHDDLTGLLNRPAAVEMIERDLSRRSRDGLAVAALFVDLDGLKAINDRHGHAAGDDALRLTAQALQAATRASDVVARLGGDEFIVAGMVQEVPAEVQTLAQRVHDAVVSQELALPDETVSMRCSIGIALAVASDDATTLISRADAAMYAAKRSGRNRIAWDDLELEGGPDHPGGETASADY